MNKPKLQLHFQKVQSSSTPIAIGMTVNNKFYPIGENFKDLNTEKSLGYVGPPDRLSRRMFNLFLICSLRAQDPLKLGELTNLGGWTNRLDTVYRDIQAMFTDFKPGHRVFRLGDSRKKANEKTPVNFELPLGMKLQLETAELAHSYLEGLLGEAWRPETPPAAESGTIWLSAPEGDGRLLRTLQDWAFLVVHDTGGAHSPLGELLGLLTDSRVLLLGVGASLGVRQAFELGAASVAGIPVLSVDLVPKPTQHPLIASLHEPRFLLGLSTNRDGDVPTALVRRLNYLTVPTDAQPHLDLIVQMGDEAAKNWMTPMPEMDLPGRIRIEGSVAAAFKKQQELGRRTLLTGSGTARFLNIITKYSDRRYKTRFERSIDGARRARASDLAIIRAFCLSGLA